MVSQSLASPYHHGNGPTVTKNEGGTQIETAEKALTILRSSRLASEHDVMGPGKDQTSEPAEAISCFCMKCGTKIGSFRNSWLQISRSYCTPLDGGISGHDGIRLSGKAKVAAKGTELEGYTIKSLSCVICNATLGARCLEALPEVRRHQLTRYVNRDFFKRSKFSLMSDISNLAVEARMIESSSNSTGEPSNTGSSLANSSKPPYSYVQLIGSALLSSPNRALTVTEIIKWLRETYPYYRNPSVNVSSNVSANLSMCKDFIKQDKTSQIQGRTNLWVINPGAIHKYALNSVLQPQKKSQTPISFAARIDTTMETPLSDNVPSHSNQSRQVNPTDLAAEAQMTASEDQNPSELQRLNEVCVLLEAITRSQKQDIERVSGAVEQIERTMKDLSNSMEQMKHETLVRSQSLTPARQHNYNQEIELLTTKLTSVGRKAQEVDELKLQLGLMNAKLKKMEEMSDVIDSIQSTATLRNDPPCSGDLQESSRRPPAISTEVLREGYHLPNPADDLGAYKDDTYGETVNANKKRSRQASRDLGNSDTAVGGSLGPCPTASLLVFDDPEDVDYKPGQQRGTSNLRRVRGGTRERFTRGNVRQSSPGRLPTPEWEKPGFTYKPAPDGFYSPLITPKLRRGRMVARRGTGGASYPDPKRAKLQLESTTQLPLRNEEGIRLKPNGEPDMRGQWRRLKEQKKLLMEQDKASSQQLQDHSEVRAALGQAIVNDPVEHRDNVLNINNPNHATVMKKIFPSGLPRHMYERRKSLAEQLFGPDEAEGDQEGDKVEAMAQATEIAATEDESSEVEL